MDLNKLSFIALAAVVLAGCSTTKPAPTQFVPVTTVRVVSEIKYEQLPDITVPATPALREVQFDLPRNTTAEPIVRSTTECLEVPPELQDLAFWERCGQFPIDPNSNIFIGLDQENFNNLQYNLETLRQYIGVLKERIAIGNDERADARARNN